MAPSTSIVAGVSIAVSSLTALGGWGAWRANVTPEHVSVEAEAVTAHSLQPLEVWHQPEAEAEEAEEVADVLAMTSLFDVEDGMCWAKQKFFEAHVDLAGSRFGAALLPFVAFDVIVMLLGSIGVRKLCKRRASTDAESHIEEAEAAAAAPDEDSDADAEVLEAEEMENEPQGVGEHEHDQISGEAPTLCAVGVGGLPPWWANTGLKPEGPEKDHGSWTANTFSADQQDRFGVDDDGKIIDETKFAAAIKASKVQDYGVVAPKTSRTVGGG